MNSNILSFYVFYHCLLFENVNSLAVFLLIYILSVCYVLQTLLWFANNISFASLLYFVD